MRPSPRVPRHLLTPLLAAALAGAALLGAPGCAGEADVRPPPDNGVDPAEQARIDQSRKALDEATRATSEKRYADAREALKDATALAVESHRFEIAEATEKLDKREAKLWANEVADQLDQKECDAAFKQVAEQIAALQSDAFTHEIRRLLQTPAAACLSAKVDEATSAGKLGAARAMVAADTTQAVLGEAAAKKMLTELDATITEALFGQLSEDLAAKRWAGAVEKIEAAEKRGDATEGQRRALLGRVRNAAAPDLAATAAEAIGARDAAATLKRVEADVDLLKWQVLAPDVAALAPDKAMPEDLLRKHAALAAWVEAQRLRMKPLKKPEKRWTHGIVAVAPSGNAEGPSKRDIKPSAEVWVLGQTKDLALVAESDPGTAALASTLDAAVGWVPLKRLAGESTVDWIPPDDQLKGERVWGPLRDKQPTLELGVVSEVKDGQIIVKRLADDAEIKVTRAQLRSGRLAKGTKVLAFCKAQNDTATIFEVMPGGRIARIQCEGGTQKEESLASLRSKPELLPPSK